MPVDDYLNWKYIIYDKQLGGPNSVSHIKVNQE